MSFPARAIATGAFPSGPAIAAVRDACLGTGFFYLDNAFDSECTIRKVLRQMHAFFGLDDEFQGSLSQRLVEIAKKFESKQYAPAWEATAEGPQIHLHRCPFAEIIQENPELCLMDQAAMELILGKDVYQKRKLQKNAEGLPLCSFSLEDN